MHTIVVAPDASQRVRDMGEELADYLGRITDVSFSVEQGDGRTGVAVGVYDDFPALALEDRFNPEQIAGREAYLLRTHEDGVHVIGATPHAVQHAVWDFLYRIGHRQFFPTDTWEIIPNHPELRVALDVFERPDFHTRIAPRGAPWSDRGRWTRWHERNRMTSDFRLRTGHEYRRIIRRNQEAFDANPQYFAKLDDGTRGGWKFCISNDELREMVVHDAIDRIGLDDDSISMDPSDGGGWCTCEPCAEMGSVSDRVVILANEVAEAINELGYGEKYVGIYAYNFHAAPPKVKVHPNVVVSVATRFTRGHTVEELVEGWSSSETMLGIRDYHDVHTWSRAMPRRARGGNVNYLTEKIPYFHERGARFMNSESSDSWGANGLGYYLSSRLLWDVDEAGRVDEIIDDFLARSFGSAREPMREFYHLIALDRDTPRSRQDVVARMYRHLADARALAGDPAVRERIDELILYARYVELYTAYHIADGDARQTAAETLFRHACRMRETMMVHIQGLRRVLRGCDSSVEIPPEADPGHLSLGSPGQDYAPWKSSEPFDDAEIADILQSGIENNEPTVFDFDIEQFSDDLVPAAEAMGLPAVETLDRPFRPRNQHTIFTWFEPGRDELRLDVTAGTLSGTRGDVTFELFSPDEVTNEPVATATVPPDEQEREVMLTTPYEGLHTLEWTDGGDRTHIAWPADTPWTFRSSLEEPMGRWPGRWGLYFYVPRGTEVVAGYAWRSTGRGNPIGQIRDGDGNIVFVFEDEMDERGYFTVEVPEGQDGKLWRFHENIGQRILLTVPPYMARNERALLLPREVVEADRSP